MRNFTISKFLCTQCNNETFLPRKASQQRERNHLKKIYCIKCRDEMNHVEKREFDWEVSGV
jgi:ribosomal protein L33